MTVNTRYGKITASKRTLNEISADLFGAGNYYENCELYALASDARTVAAEIHDALDMVGYYDNLK